MKIDFNNYKKYLKIISHVVESKNKVQMTFEDDGVLVLLYPDQKASVRVNCSYELEEGEAVFPAMLIDREEFKHIINSYDLDTYIFRQKEDEVGYHFVLNSDNIQLSASIDPSMVYDIDVAKNFGEGKPLNITADIIRAVNDNTKQYESEDAISCITNQIVCYGRNKVFFNPCPLVQEGDEDVILTPMETNLISSMQDGDKLFYHGEMGYSFYRGDELAVVLNSVPPEVGAIDSATIKTLRGGDLPFATIPKKDIVTAIQLLAPMFKDNALKPLTFEFKDETMIVITFSSDTNDFRREVEARVPDEFIGERIRFSSEPLKIFCDKFAGVELDLTYHQSGAVFTKSLDIPEPVEGEEVEDLPEVEPTALVDETCVMIARITY